MSADKDGGAPLGGQVLVTVAFSALGVVITWLGVNDWRLTPSTGQTSPSVAASEIGSPTLTPEGREDQTSPRTAAPSTPRSPKMTLTLTPSSVEDYDGQTDLVFRATLSSNLPEGKKVLFELKSAPGLSGFDYSIERPVKQTGTATARFRVSPCGLLDLDYQIAATAEGDYVVIVQDIQSGTVARAVLPLRLAPGADEFDEWRGGRCVIY